MQFSIKKKNLEEMLELPKNDVVPMPGLMWHCKLTSLKVKD